MHLYQDKTKPAKISIYTSASNRSDLNIAMNYASVILNSLHPRTILLLFSTPRHLC